MVVGEKVAYQVFIGVVKILSLRRGTLISVMNLVDHEYLKRLLLLFFWLFLAFFC